MCNKLAESIMRVGWRLEFAAIGAFIGGVLVFPPGEISNFICDWIVLPLAVAAYVLMMIGAVVYDPFSGEKNED